MALKRHGHRNVPYLLWHFQTGTSLTAIMLVAKLFCSCRLIILQLTKKQNINISTTDKKVETAHHGTLVEIFIQWAILMKMNINTCLQIFSTSSVYNFNKINHFLRWCAYCHLLHTTERKLKSFLKNHWKNFFNAIQFVIVKNEKEHEFYWRFKSFITFSSSLVGCTLLTLRTHFSKNVKNLWNDFGYLVSTTKARHRVTWSAWVMS